MTVVIRRVAAVAASIAIFAALSVSLFHAHASWDFIAATMETEKFFPVPDEQGGRAILILLPGLSEVAMPGDPQHNPSIGAVALLNVQTAGGQASSAAAATLSSGARARGVSDLQLVAAEGSLRAETATGGAEKFATWYGRTLPDEGAGLMDWPRLAAKSENLAHPVGVGSLGEAFRSAGARTAYVQGAGAEGCGAVVGMDAGGVLDVYMSPPASTAPSDLIPGGIRTDWDAVVETIFELEQDIRLIVVEAVDLYLVPEWLPPETAERVQEKVLDDLLDAVGQLVNSPFSEVFLVDPLPGPGDLGLAAVPARDPGELLRSATTRRAGVVSLPDISAALLQAGGLEGSIGAGRPLAAVRMREGSALEKVRRLHTAVENARSVRAPLAQFMVGLVVLAAALIVVGLLWIPRAYNVAAYTMAALALLPAAAFLAPTLSVLSPGLRLAVFWLALAALGVLLRRASGLNAAVLGVAGSICLFLCIDQLTGGRLAFLSPLGYCAVAGARYYGLGNELLGVLLGAALLISGLITENGDHPVRRVGAALFLLGCAVLVVGPRWGANFGGGLVFSAWFTGSLTVLPLRSGGWKRLLPHSLIIALGLVAGAVLISTWHRAAPAEVSTHLGMLFSAEGGESLHSVVHRKLSTAMRVLRYTVWTRAWFLLLSVYALVTFYPVGWIRNAFARRPALSSVCRTSVALSLVALVSNDSGMVTAALTMLAPVAVMLLAIREEVAAHGRRE